MIYNLPRKKKAAGETWVLNKSFSILGPYTISFLSNGVSFSEISTSGTWKGNKLYFDSTSVATGVGIIQDGEYAGWRNISNWVNETYRTITLASPATGDFLTWLEANAVKQ